MRGPDPDTLSAEVDAAVNGGANGVLYFPHVIGTGWESFDGTTDDVAARLTVDAVKGARAGLGHAEALRQAQLHLIADRSIPGGAHPAAWAPFVLLGE